MRSALRSPALEVAPRLLGWTVSHTTAEGRVDVRLTEVEAYAGADDPASHAYRGRTARTDVMFGRAGRLYVYLSYGMHWCANVVAGDEGTASAVLLRAGEVTHGHDLARERRGQRVQDVALARGPGCLGRALGLDATVNGVDLLDQGTVRLEPGPRADPEAIRTGHRVGVRLAHEYPWRFWLADEPSVSAYRRSPRA